MFDLGANVALRNTDLFAPYKVATWADVPDALKDPSGLWVSDGGYMSIGYDAGSVPAVTSVEDLLKPEFRGKVALNGNPAGIGGLQRRDDGGARQRRLGRRHRAGRRVLPSAQAGRQLSAGRSDPGHDRVGPDPGGDRLGVSRTSRRPRPWRASGTGNWWCPRAPWLAPSMSSDQQGCPPPRGRPAVAGVPVFDEGQNIWLQGFARPVRLDAMVAAGTVDKAVANLPEAKARPCS